jgi:hypothetical protein
MGLYWNAWKSVAQGSTMPGGPVTAVPWQSSYALFLADPNGGVYAIKAAPGYGWQQIPGLSTKPGTPVTALFSGGRFTLFAAADTGEIFTTSGVPYQSWNAWTPVSEGSSVPGATVAAVPWQGSVALFISDPHGLIYAIKAVPGFGWEAVPGLNTIPGAPVTAVLSGTNVTLFAADTNGGIFTTTGVPYGGWAPWTSVSEGRSTPGALVAAVPWEGSFALFLSDPNGGIYGIRALPGFGWEAIPGISTKPGASVTAILWQGFATPDRIMLFTTDGTGEVFMTSGIPYGSWDAWSSPSEGRSVPGGLITATPNPAKGIDLALFLADSLGGVFTTAISVPSAPTGLHVVSLSPEGGGTENAGNTTAMLGWTAVPTAPGSVYHIDYEITLYDVLSPTSGGSVYTTTQNPAPVILSDGHSYNIYVQAAYFDSNIGIANGTSAPSSTLVVSALALAPSVTASVVSVDIPTYGLNYVLEIKGSNFAKGEQIIVTVTWTVAGESPALFSLGPYTTDSVLGSFSATFTGNTPLGLCPISVGFGQAQPMQHFSVVVTEVVSKKQHMATAGPFTCPL